MQAILIALLFYPDGTTTAAIPVPTAAQQRAILDIIAVRGQFDLHRLGTAVSLRGSLDADRGLDAAKRLGKVRHILLDWSNATDSGLTCVEGIGELEALYLHHATLVGDDGVAHLRSARKLQTLDLGDTRVTDAGLAHIKSLVTLQSLTLTRTRITDEGLKHLERLTELRWLYLEGTEITDQGLAHLVGLKKLVTIHLEGTKVTDKGIAHLKCLPEIHRIDLSRTGVTDRGIAALQKAFPRAEINK
jgi:hypothetical protein